MAEVLKAHVYWGYMDGVGRTRCECGLWFDTDDEYIAHQAGVLAANGYGEVREAQARAYDKGYGHGKHDEKFHPAMSISGTPRPEKSRRNPYRRPE